MNYESVGWKVVAAGVVLIYAGWARSQVRQIAYEEADAAVQRHECWHEDHEGEGL